VLKDAENSLRDFIGHTLSSSLRGEQWFEKLGIPETRIDIWKERKIIEEKRQTSGVVEERM
jgi:hypothetical protein